MHIPTPSKTQTNCDAGRGRVPKTGSRKSKSLKPVNADELDLASHAMTAKNDLNWRHGLDEGTCGSKYGLKVHTAEEEKDQAKKVSGLRAIRVLHSSRYTNGSTVAGHSGRVETKNPMSIHEKNTPIAAWDDTQPFKSGLYNVLNNLDLSAQLHSDRPLNMLQIAHSESSGAWVAKQVDNGNNVIDYPPTKERGSLEGYIFPDIQDTQSTEPTREWDVLSSMNVNLQARIDKHKGVQAALIRETNLHGLRRNSSQETTNGHDAEFPKACGMGSMNEQNQNVQIRPLRPSLKSRDTAFRKMLDRLHSSGHEATAKVSGNESNIGSATTKIGDSSDTELRKPIAGTGRRAATVSDNVINYWNHDRSASDRSDPRGSEISADAALKLNSLNPRAREFLSFNHDELKSGPTTKGKSHPDVSQSKNVKNVNFYEANHSAKTFPRPSASRPSIMGYFPPTVSNEGKLPTVSLFSHPYNRNAQQQGPPMPTLASLAALQQSSLSLRPLMNPSISGLACGYPAVQNPYMPAFIPVQAPLNQMFTGQPTTPIFPSLSSAPPPVPKPRGPNASDQQAYEAWIEWRKANEPGYAVECKLRQQRRSQKTKGSSVRISNPSTNKIVSTTA